MQTLVDTLEDERWVVQGWRIRFLFSEKVIKRITKTSLYPVWYEDEATRNAWMDTLTICFTSFSEFYQTFGALPQVGDRLYDEDLGLVIADRAIDGRQKSITVTLSI